MPWNERSQETYSVGGARAVLDADHAGLDDVKERIVEYLAVRKKRQDKGLELVGLSAAAAPCWPWSAPPGVGKTSLGESVARAMGREFVRVALGGVRDEAEIRGHRRTYVGALPGRIVRAIKDAGTMNPVVLLDEIDKVGSDYRGDPTAALLEVLDPAQNHTFRDHYLEVELDLSDVVFLATANVLEAIPGPLLDRMELVRLDGYTEDEKVLIARDHLLPRQIDRAGLSVEEVLVRGGRAASAGRAVHAGGGRSPTWSAPSPGCCGRWRPRPRSMRARSRPKARRRFWIRALRARSCPSTLLTPFPPTARPTPSPPLRPGLRPPSGPGWSSPRTP